MASLPDIAERHARRRARLCLGARLLPIVALCGSAAVLTWNCLGMMQCGAAESAGSGARFAWVAFVASVVLILLVESASIARRVQWPEHKLRLALQRIRAGDVGFRVALRRGDPLAGLAHECNELLDWLNANPPAGVRVGTDIVEVPLEVEDRES